MSEVKQTIPGVELTSPCSCLVYWALERPNKSAKLHTTLLHMMQAYFLHIGLFFYIQIYWV